RYLGNLREQHVCVAQKHGLHFTVMMELVLEPGCENPIGAASTLHHGPARGVLSAREMRDANQALVSHYRNLCRSAVFEHVRKRNDAIDRKVYVARDATGLTQY